ncbi:MAG TPA: hypothetical protein VHY37_05935 [Tepidisphaeraceae bacterium]|jgi:hypothetical protein|nr:hypothetical protein [Tepidisphaeraceae bacterium]
MTQKIQLKPAARRSARPRRARTALVLRIEPELARWYAAAAELQGRSRTQFMERWLNVLRTLSDHMEHYQHRGVSPFDAVDVVGADFVGELIRLGLANDLMKQAWELHLTEHRINGDGKHTSTKTRKRN